MSDDLRLRVVASTIDGRGTAKLDGDSFSRLKLGDGGSIVVTYGAKSREMRAALDTIYGERTIRLMRQDMEQLRVQEGMEVTVSPKNARSRPRKAPAPGGKKDGTGRGRKGRKRKKADGKAASLDRF